MKQKSNYITEYKGLDGERVSSVKCSASLLRYRVTTQDAKAKNKVVRNARKIADLIEVCSTPTVYTVKLGHILYVSSNYNITITLLI